MRLLVKIDTEEKKEMKIHPYKKPLCSSRIFLPPLSTIQFKQTYRRTKNKQMPCPFTGPKKFWAGPIFLCQTKNLFTYCGSRKHFVPDEKMICIQ